VHSLFSNKQPACKREKKTDGKVRNIKKQYKKKTFRAIFTKNLCSEKLAIKGCGHEFRCGAILMWLTLLRDHL